MPGKRRRLVNYSLTSDEEDSYSDETQDQRKRKQPGRTIATQTAQFSEVNSAPFIQTNLVNDVFSLAHTSKNWVDSIHSEEEEEEENDESSSAPRGNQDGKVGTATPNEETTETENGEWNFGCLSKAEREAAFNLIRKYFPVPVNVCLQPEDNEINESNSGEKHQVEFAESCTNEKIGTHTGMGKREKVTFSERKCDRAFKGAIYCRSLTPDQPTSNLIMTLDALASILKEVYVKLLEEQGGLKGWVAATFNYRSLAKDTEYSHGVETPNRYITNEFEIDDVIRDFIIYLVARNSRMERQQSGLQFQHVENITIKAVKYDPLPGRCHSELPPYLARKRSIMNIKNKDEKCFGYAIAAYYLHKELNSNFPDKETSPSETLKCKSRVTRKKAHKPNPQRPTQ